MHIHINACLCVIGEASSGIAGQGTNTRASVREGEQEKTGVRSGGAVLTRARTQKQSRETGSSFIQGV